MRFWTNVAQSRNEILLRGIENGRRIKHQIPYKPKLYLASQGQGSNMRALDGTPVEPMEFGSINEARDFVREYSDGEGMKIYGVDKWVYSFIAEEYPGKIVPDLKHVRIGTIDIETEVGKGFPDPEEAAQKITAITFKVGDRIMAFALPPIVGDNWAAFKPTDRRVEYRECHSEEELLLSFLTKWSSDELCPDVMTGWNIEGFDVPYLVNRITRVLGAVEAKRLSPWRRLEKKRAFIRGKEKEYMAPLGIAILDYPPLYKKLAVATRAVDTPDNYKLDTIAAHESVGRKIDYHEYDGLMGLYLNNFQLFMEYNIRDVELVEKIEAKRGLIELVLMKSYSNKVNFEDAMGSVRPWEQIIHCHLLERGIVMPPRKEAEKKELVGAFVKDPEPAMYRWVVSEDLDSLYSHLMMQWNISPETKVGYIDELRFRPSPDGDLREEALKHIEFFSSGVVDKYRDYLREHDLVVAANGVLYRREKGFLPEILVEMYDGRKVAKANAIDAQDRYEKSKDAAILAEAGRWKNEDKVKKTDLNACYGVTTNQYYIFYDHDNAEAITMGGQLAIKWIEGKLNQMLNEVLGTEGKDFVIAIDTDSVYLKLDELVERTCAGKTPGQVCEFLDRVCKKQINPYISQSYQELADYVNAAEQKMSMKRESIADRAIWTGKKHYILNILDKEGVRYKEPKIELKGIAAVKSDTPPAAREALKKTINLIMTATEEDVLDHIEKVRNDFMTLPFDEIAFSKGINHMEKYSSSTTIFAKGCPFQVKAALVYNDMLKRHKLDYPPIFDGDKVRLAYIKQPNLMRSDIIATPGPLPASFKIEDVLDRHKQFENGFMTPLRSILDAIKWKTERTSSLEEFF